MIANPGYLPPECEICNETGEVVGYHRVHIRLFGGFDSRHAGHDPWPAYGQRPPTNWSIRSDNPHPFDIQFYEVI